MSLSRGDPEESANKEQILVDPLRESGPPSLIGLNLAGQPWDKAQVSVADLKCRSNH